jgi:hypothetical protein
MIDTVRALQLARHSDELAMPTPTPTIVLGTQHMLN